MVIILPQNNGGKWTLFCGTHSTGKCHLKIKQYHPAVSDDTGLDKIKKDLI